MASNLGTVKFVNIYRVEVNAIPQDGKEYVEVTKLDKCADLRQKRSQRFWVLSLCHVPVD